MGVVVFPKVRELANFTCPWTFANTTISVTLRIKNIPAKNSKSCSFSTLLNYQNMILDVSENSWMVMSTAPPISLDGNVKFSFSGKATKIWSYLPLDLIFI